MVLWCGARARHASPLLLAASLFLASNALLAGGGSCPQVWLLCACGLSVLLLMWKPLQARGPAALSRLPQDLPLMLPMGSYSAGPLWLLVLVMQASPSLNRCPPHASMRMRGRHPSAGCMWSGLQACALVVGLRRRSWR